MHICVVNASARVTDAEVHLATRAIAHQVRYDFAPVWGVAQPLISYKAHVEDVEVGSILITIEDKADVDGALGYHDEQGHEVQYGRIFCDPIFDNGGTALAGELSMSAVLSHEVLEAIVDPRCQLFAANLTSGVLYCYETADPVEENSYDVTVSGQKVAVSDFVTPDWFDDLASGPFDFLGVLKKPFSLAKGGYATISQAGALKQVFGEHYPGWKKDTPVKSRPNGR